MLHGDAFGLLLGAVALGAVHGVEPGHGWPVAASYALDRSNKWLYGFAAGLIIGVGHLVSSIAMVAAFFHAKSYFALADVDEPITIVGDLQVGGPVSIVAGVLLVALGIREYRYGHSHGHSHDHGDHGHGDHDHGDHGHGDHDHGHDEGHGDPEETADRGLWGIAWFAFVLGFAHEEEFEIIALCAGTTDCLELMTAYALAVILGIVGLTMSLIAGYSRAEARLGRYTPYLPAVSAGVLIIMGFGFIAGVL